MESNYEIKTTDIKNRTFYYFDKTIKIEDFDFDILIEEKYENVLAYNISNKNFDWCKSIMYWVQWGA